ncbi:MAG: large conductance mechanosensitive channel [Cocleimonas sp.]|jgi:large conductance mechanosensitive channel
MGMVSDFKDFAMGGNLIDMATGIIIGIASGKLITSLVSDVIMPPIGVALGGVNFADLGYQLAATGSGDKGLEPIMLKYGAFIQSFIDFLIIMAVVFIIVKIATRNKEPEPEAGPSQEDLLTEIRDALQKK